MLCHENVLTTVAGETSDSGGGDLNESHFPLRGAARFDIDDLETSHDVAGMHHRNRNERPDFSGPVEQTPLRHPLAVVLNHYDSAAGTGEGIGVAVIAEALGAQASRRSQQALRLDRS